MLSRSHVRDPSALFKQAESDGVLRLTHSSVGMTLKQIKDHLKKLFVRLSPLLVYKISGKSMLPQYKDGDTVIALKFLFDVEKNDVVVCLDPRTKRLLLKRIQDSRCKIQGFKEYFVIGDNDSASTDSRHFGWMKRKDIIGKVMFHIQK